jgi:hypothetical protein
MRSLKQRLQRLEGVVIRPRAYLSFWDIPWEVPEGFDPNRDLDPSQRGLWDALVTLPKWLKERGYGDARAAVEAGEQGPPGLEALLREQAERVRDHSDVIDC